MSALKSGKPICTTGKNLAGLWRPSFVKVNHQLFVFGGGGNVTDNLHALDLYTMRWDAVQALKGKAPSKRYGHTATRWNDSIVIFGGCNEFQEYCNDVYIFNLHTLTWTSPEVSNIVPARYLHSATVYDDKLFVYGGFAKSMECTYVLDELNVLDLHTMVWTKYQDVPPRYNHSATLIGQKMYIYGGKDEHGSTVSDLYMINLLVPPYTPHLVLSGEQSSTSSKMVLLKSQHFCDAVCGKLLVFGRYLSKIQEANHNNSVPEAAYSLWMLDLDTLEWERQECNMHFEVGGWNYFTAFKEQMIPGTEEEDDQSVAVVNSLLFLGNTDTYRPQGYDHFRDALVINSETLGLYDIGPPCCLNQLSQLLTNPELSDFVIVVSGGQEIQVHQVILITRWPHFRNMYNSGMTEALERRLEIPEPYEVVMVLLKYLYTDRLDENGSWDVLCQVLVVANMYLLSRLKKMCCEQLYRRHMSVESCGTIFEKAILTDEIGLKMLTLDFIFRNYGSVLKSSTLMHMPLLVHQEFLEAIPDEAVLDIGQMRTSNITKPIGSKTSGLSKTYSTPSLAYSSSDNIYHTQSYTSVNINVSTDNPVTTDVIIGI
ncbi:hypothetical protein CLU79DRAFT_756555 [Phycomyces nitens]|nr:hypothetical protein CLU79DRAFT_756555 [Phycomyces nitens]